MKTTGGGMKTTGGGMQPTRVVGALLLSLSPFAGLGCGTSASSSSTSEASNSSATSASSGGGQSSSGQQTGDSTEGTSHSSSTSVAQVTDHSTASSSVGGGSSQGNACGAVGQACCTASGGVVAVFCNVGVTCCEPQATCALDCTALGDAGAEAGPACGSVGDAGHAVSGSCPAGQQCCDEGHTGAPFVFDCIPVTTPCVPKP